MSYEPTQITFDPEAYIEYVEKKGAERARTQNWNSGKEIDYLRKECDYFTGAMVVFFQIGMDPPAGWIFAIMGGQRILT